MIDPMGKHYLYQYFRNHCLFIPSPYFKGKTMGFHMDTKYGSFTKVTVYLVVAGNTLCARGIYALMHICVEYFPKR